MIFITRSPHSVGVGPADKYLVHKLEEGFAQNVTVNLQHLRHESFVVFSFARFEPLQPALQLSRCELRYVCEPVFAAKVDVIAAAMASGIVCSALLFLQKGVLYYFGCQWFDMVWCCKAVHCLLIDRSIARSTD